MKSKIVKVSYSSDPVKATGGKVEPSLDSLIERIMIENIDESEDTFVNTEVKVQWYTGTVIYSGTGGSVECTVHEDFIA